MRFAVCEPGEYCHSRKSPLFPETPAGQFALLGAGLHGLSGDFEKRGNLLQREDLVARLGSMGDLDSANGQRTRNGQSVSKELTDQGLFAEARLVGEAVEFRGLGSRQPHE